MTTTAPHSPKYTPPEGIRVLDAGFVLEQRMSTRVLSATIIDLASRSHFTVKPIHGAYKDIDLLIHRSGVRPHGDDSTSEEKIILGSLFDHFDTDVIHLADAIGTINEKISNQEIAHRVHSRLLQEGWYTHSVIKKMLLSHSTYLGGALI